MNKVAVITGGTRGIGLETAKLFLENGYNVAIFGSRKESVDDALNKLSLYKEKVIGYFPNLTKEDEIEKTLSKIYDIFGRIDVLINNAGVSSNTLINDYTKQEIDKIFDINFKAPFLCCKAVVKYLKQTKGVILNTSSMVSFYGQKSGCLYPMSKFAINGLTKSLARELAPYGIRVNAVAPGITKTDMVKNLPENMIEPILKNIPLQRMGEPIDIANAFLFLASDEASFITGDIIKVDGGIIN